MITPATSSRPQAAPRPKAQHVDAQPDKFAGPALLCVVILNGLAALVLLSAFAFGVSDNENSKLVSAMLFFGSGAVAALLSAFIAYYNRILHIEVPEFLRLRYILRIVAMLAVLASGACFLVGLNLAGTANINRSSTHPKTKKIQGRDGASMPAVLLPGEVQAALSAAGFDAETRRRPL